MTSRAEEIIKRLKLFEAKYGCRFEDLEARVLNPETPEIFEEWDDYIEWKAYAEMMKSSG